MKLYPWALSLKQLFVSENVFAKKNRFSPLFPYKLTNKIEALIATHGHSRLVKCPIGELFASFLRFQNAPWCKILSYIFHTMVNLS